ncbi:MAG: TSUP family transporter [SAR324 cluster bacterium]|nr:TSUP family transporter [SAR324 cluster bacterium]
MLDIITSSLSAYSIIDISILCLAAFIAGFIDSIAGGGGLISLPALLFVNVPVHQALATSKLQSTFGTFNTSYQYIKQGYCSLNDVKYAILLTLLGAFSGALVVFWIDGEIVLYLIPILLGLLFVYFLKGAKGERKLSTAKLGYYSFYSIFGFGIGFYDGFFGPGTGAIWMASLLYFMAQDMRSALGHTKVMNATSNFASLIIFGWLGLINYPLGLIMAVFQLGGSTLGTKLAIKKGSKIIRPLLLTVVFVSVIKTFYDIYLK